MAMNWEWKRSGEHESQPLLEWWVEQAAVVIVYRIGRRAHRRGDLDTLARMIRICKAGALTEFPETEVRPFE